MADITVEDAIKELERLPQDAILCVLCGDFNFKAKSIYLDQQEKKKGNKVVTIKGIFRY